jgi:prepilin-type N-terminal cleavage/methylation domain-containing protein
MKQKGFTIIELFVAITIMAMLATMAGQTFYNSKNLQRFDSEIKNVFFGILDARTNAISEKKCSDGRTGEIWDLKINQSGFVLSCGGTAEENIPFSEILILESVEFPPEIGIKTNVKLEFLQELAQLRIKNEVSGIFYSKREAKIVFHHTSFPNEKRTICIDRVAGFPSLEIGDTCS